MKFDSKVPSELKKTQQWFGSIIGRAIDDDSRINPLSPSGQPIEEEAADFIAPSPTLRPAQRIEIYNQQYWWRLLNALHESFPFLMRLFGYHEFNKVIAIPYLTKYPPRHWSLSLLGDRLSQWIEEDYHAEDKTLVLNSSRLDWAYSHSFLARQLKPLTASQLPSDKDMSSLLKKKMYVQSHVHLFQFPCNMLEFRMEFMKQEPDYWIENDFPKLKYDKTYFFNLYRTPKNDISWHEITEGEYHLLHLFQVGSTINKACQWLEKQEAYLYEAAMKNLHLWFQEWTIRQWLSLEKPSKLIHELT